MAALAFLSFIRALHRGGRRGRRGSRVRRSQASRGQCARAPRRWHAYPLRHLFHAIPPVGLWRGFRVYACFNFDVARGQLVLESLQGGLPAHTCVCARACWRAPGTRARHAPCMRKVGRANRFCHCERCSEAVTTMPVGRWVSLTAVSTLFCRAMPSVTPPLRTPPHSTAQRARRQRTARGGSFACLVLPARPAGAVKLDVRLGL